MEHKAQAPRFGFYDRLTAAFPSQVIVDATEVCNLACIHCPHPTFKKSEHYSGSMIATELNKKLIDEISTAGKGLTQYVRYTSNGEPLVHPQIMEMLAYATKHSGTDVTLTTNGKVMREAQTERLLEIGVNLIDISIDAFKAETYAKIRVGGNLAVTSANILRLLKRKDELRSKTKVVLSFIEQPENMGETEDFEKYWRDAGADFVVVRRLHSAAGAKTDIAQTLWSNANTEPRKPCVYPWERILLNAKGQLSFCPTDWSHGSAVVDYRTTTVAETWQGEFYQKLRKAHMDNNFSCHKFCGQCPDWSVTRWPDEGRAYADMVTELGRDGAEVTQA